MPQYFSVESFSSGKQPFRLTASINFTEHILLQTQYKGIILLREKPFPHKNRKKSKIVLSPGLPIHPSPKMVQ